MTKDAVEELKEELGDRIKGEIEWGQPCLIKYENREGYRITFFADSRSYGMFEGYLQQSYRRWEEDGETHLGLDTVICMPEEVEEVIPLEEVSDSSTVGKVKS